jgi:hypothetical protein
VRNRLSLRAPLQRSFDRAGLIQPAPRTSSTFPAP